MAWSIPSRNRSSTTLGGLSRSFQRARYRRPLPLTTTLLDGTAADAKITRNNLRCTGSAMSSIAARYANIRRATLREKIYRPFLPGSTKVDGAPSKIGSAGSPLANTRSMICRYSALVRLKSTDATLASIRSARKGFTSIVVGLTPKNCAASAVVPDPPNGSEMWRTDARVSVSARSTSSGSKASLNRRHFWNAREAPSAFVHKSDTLRLPIQSLNCTDVPT